MNIWKKKEKEEELNVWLDDMRDPITFAPGGREDQEDASWREIEPEREWRWVKNKAELAELLNSTSGRIDRMSFDHDLGGHYEPTGYDIIKWLADEHLDRYPVKTYVHSANPVGAKNIRMFDANVRKHLIDN